MSPKLTNHAKERMKERAGLDKNGSLNLATKALTEGLSHSDTQGQLRKYLDGLFLKHRNGNNIRIFAEKVFIFHNQTLITVFKLDKRLNKIAVKLMKRIAA